MDHNDFLGEDDDLKEDKSENTADADAIAKVQEAKEPKNSEEDLNPNLIQVTLSCSHVLHSSDFDYINLYGMVNENCSFYETVHICMNCQKFDNKEGKSLLYVDCKRECHDRDEDDENLMVGKIK